MAQESWNRDQDETGCHPPEGPVQCANNCGFFGSRTTMNLCSKCYRDTVLVVSQTSKNSSSSSSSSRAIRMVDITGPTRITGGDAEAVPVFITPSAAAALAAQPSLAAASSASPSRCFSCRKRVGLTGFKCRCGDVFCSTHRYSDKHDCSFDYKAAGRDSIAKANPVVVASKIEKI